MIFSWAVLFGLLPAVAGTAMDDYVWREDENYNWVSPY
jgi:hypothetical protein